LLLHSVSLILHLCIGIFNLLDMIKMFKEKTLIRLKKAKGQVDGLIKLVESDTYCVDIITQILALEGSLSAVSRLLLENHLNTCGVKYLTSKQSKKREKFIKEIIKIVEFSSR